MIWSPKRIAYYIDDPANVYAEYTPSTLNALNGAVCPSIRETDSFLSSTWRWAELAREPDRTTVFPAEVLVDYVRVYSY